jgi:aminoglycoside 2'-N-acetyltransferase I
VRCSARLWLVEIRVVRSRDLSPEDLADVRALLDAAFAGEFSEDDWNHTLGGWHITARDVTLVAHAAAVERRLVVGDRPVRAGYVEGVGTAPDRRRQGLGSAVMKGIAEVLRTEFALGALSTGDHAFYERLGWERWQGPTFVRRGGRLVRTAEEDDGIMVLRYGTTAALDLILPIACDARPGDDW